MNFKITHTNKPSTELFEALCKGLEAHALQQIGQPSFQPFGFVAQDEKGSLLGGCTGFFMYGYLHIRLLWVDEKVRKQGLGQLLMAKAEELAKEHYCRYIMIETFSYQAKPFYEKLGFKVEFTYEGFDQGAQFFFMRKRV